MSDINRDSVGLRRYSTAVNIAKCALFVVVMIVAAFIRIPIPYIPLTFQTVAAVLAGLLLGPKWGGAAVAVYVFMGLLGLPVFAGGSGGFSYVLQLSFGYLVGFIAAAVVSGIFAGRKVASFRRNVAAAMVAVGVNYFIGTAYFMLMWVYYYHNAGAWNALLLYNLIYLPKDAVLCFLAAVLAVRVYPMINKNCKKVEKVHDSKNEEISENSFKKDHGTIDKEKNL